MVGHTFNYFWQQQSANFFVWQYLSAKVAAQNVRIVSPHDEKVGLVVRAEVRVDGMPVIGRQTETAHW
jgi:hypothetical protein